MPSHQCSRRQFSRMIGGVLAAPFGASSLQESLTTPRPSTRWRFETGAEIGVLPGFHRGTPVIGETLFVQKNDTLRAVGRVDGDQRWQLDVGTENWDLVVGDGAVYVVGDDSVRSFDPDGTERWESRLEGRGDSVYGATEVGETVYASSTGGLYALDATTGDERWAFEENIGTPRVTDDAVYGTASDISTETLYALDPSDGTERWRFELEDQSGDEDAPAFLAGVNDGTCYLWVGGELYAVDTSTGTELWQFETDDDSWGFSGRLTESAAYVWSRDERTLHAVDAESGTVEWRFEASSRPWYIIEAVDEKVIVETETAIHALDATDGTRWWRRGRKLQPDEFAGEVDGDVVYTQDEGVLYALDVADGSVRWRFAPDDEAVVYARGIDDTVFAGTSEGTLYALGGPVRTPIGSALHGLRTNVGTLSLVTLLGGGLVATGYRRLQERNSNEEPDGNTASTEIEFREPIDADGRLESYEARLPDGREVVAKRLSEDADVTRDQFLKAVETWAELDHENVRPVLDWGTEPAPWVALPDATGQPVADCGELTVAERVEALAVVCEAVHDAHRDEITHGRLSPDDVRLPAQDCQPADVRVGGWLARIRSEQDSQLLYAAPEQIAERKIDPVRADVYRLGAVAYHAVAGQPPDDKLTPLAELNAEIPTEIDDVLTDAMATDPDERYRSALKLADMLRWAVRQ